MEPGSPSSPDPESPSSPSVGFNTDQIPHTHTSRASEDDEASVDPNIVPDDREEPPEEEEDGEDLFNDNFMESVSFFFPSTPLYFFVLTTFPLLR